jgi:hypothetical protein
LEQSRIELIGSIMVNETLVDGRTNKTLDRSSAIASVTMLDSVTANPVMAA